MISDPVISACALTKSYDYRCVLDQLDLTIECGCAIGLLGTNGAGKTTLLKCLLGLLPVDDGRCTMLGEPSSTLTAAARERLSYVPQTHRQFGWLTGEEMLCYIGACYSTFDWEYSNKLAARWGLALRSAICLLSPEQQQRLSIVRALSTRPDVLILDEPLASMDSGTRSAVIDELIGERARRCITVVISSHIVDAGDLGRLCTKFAILSRGRIDLMPGVESARVRLEVDEIPSQRSPFQRQFLCARRGEAGESWSWSAPRLSACRPSSRRT